ncbi:hypothetical protein NQD34_005278 [Periophthalmus magnuspinnatus]|nr:hypothetical protein NQD34_005278 [Periophthalmus magnuspinnatus]
MDVQQFSIVFITGAIVGAIIALALRPYVTIRAVFESSLVFVDAVFCGVSLYSIVTDIMYKCHSSQEVVFMVAVSVYMCVAVAVPVIKAYGRAAGLVVTLGAAFGKLIATWGNMQLFTTFTIIYAGLIFDLISYGELFTRLCS